VSDTLETLAEKADDLAAKFREPATFELVRGALNEAGVTQARRALGDALAGLAKAQEEKRRADGNEREAREKLDRLLVDAEWTLTPPDVNEAGAKLLADDKKAWKRREVQKDPTVVAATGHLRDMEHLAAVARDALTVADKRLSACRADLDAAVATLNALAMALPARKAAQ
jgi:hypothetical protein